MAKINRYDGDLKAFASEALGTERTIFGDAAQSDTLDANITADFLRGWGIVGASENPTKQDFNGLGFTLGQILAYLHQAGVPEWNGGQEYHSGSFANRAGVAYTCLTDNHVSVTPPESDDVNWFNVSTSGQNIAVFNTPTVTSWTVPAVLQAGLRKAHLTVIGGGGGGAKNSITSHRSNGGGGGGAAVGLVNLTGVASVTVTVGSGGAGASSAGTSGGVGQTSSFGAFISATGGNSLGYNGGDGSGGDTNFAGGAGKDATDASNGGGSADGGASIFSGEGKSASSYVPAAVDGQAPGAGGGGVPSGATQGGNGKAGIVIIRW